LGKSGPVGVAIINSANLVGAILGGLMLGRYGRKTLIVFWSFFMAIFMILMGVVYNSTASNFELFFMVGFILCFQFSLGTIPWLYMAEIMTNKGMSAAVVTSAVFTLIISLTSNFLLTAMNGGAFVMFGLISLLVSTLL
jgi:SP family arabinose:H+ symporter-like MFS transporter